MTYVLAQEEFTAPGGRGGLLPDVTETVLLGILAVEWIGIKGGWMQPETEMGTVYARYDLGHTRRLHRRRRNLHRRLGIRIGGRD